MKADEYALILEKQMKSQKEINILYYAKQKYLQALEKQNGLLCWI